MANDRLALAHVLGAHGGFRPARAATWVGMELD